MLVVKLWSVSGELSYALMTSAIWRQWQINLTSIYATNKISVGSQRPRFCVYHFIFNHLISNVVIQHQIYSNYSSQKSLFLIWWNSSTQRYIIAKLVVSVVCNKEMSTMLHLVGPGGFPIVALSCQQLVGE